MVSVGLLYEKNNAKNMFLLGSRMCVTYSTSDVIYRRYGILYNANKDFILLRCLDANDKVLNDVRISISAIKDVKIVC